MKPGTLTTGRLLLSLIMLLLTVGLVSWDQQQSPGQYGQAVNDTTPKNKTDRKIRDLDEALEELNKGEWKEEMDRAMKEMKEAMKNIDGDKIRLDIEKAMKEVDFNKIKEEINTAMKEVDFNKIKEEINAAMKEIDFSKMQTELKESMAKIDFDKIKIEMDKVKEEMKDIQPRIEKEMEKVKEEMKDLQPRIEKEMEKAKVQMEKAKGEIEKAKVEIKEYKDFVDGLEKDGLIEKSNYEIKYRNGELLINGKKAADKTYNKYRSFLEKHKEFKIEKSNDHFNIDMD